MTTDSPRVHVAAAVLADAGGRILLARRTEGRDLAGAWEFPGGKLEAGESAAVGLVRELREELGIEVDPGDCEQLIAVPFAYADKRILLDVFRVVRWDGAPKGLEHQALAWAPPERLHRYPMPPADRPVIAALRQPEGYLITPEPGDDHHAFVERIERALAAGWRRIQLRARSLDTDTVRPLAAQIAARCREAGAELLLNGDIALARELALGVHLRASQLGELGKRPLPDGQPVAASCHTADELARAEALGVDFAVLGPVRRTPSHPAVAPLGWEGFAGLRERTTLPLYALGGLRPEDLAQARRHGAQGVAGISAFWPRPV